MSQTYRAVIFDFGGVFTTSPVENFADYEHQNGIPERFISGVIKANINNGSFAQFERNEIDLETFDKLFAEETAAAGHEITGRTLVSLLKLNFHPQMIDALASVQDAGFQTGCITNNMAVAGAEDMVTGDDRKLLMEIFQSFDHVIESSKAGVRKPEPRIYEMMCETLKVAADECIFLDDLGINLKPARVMGMKTIKVPFGDVTPAINELFVLLQMQQRTPA
ncbi:MAG: HAD-IA family hydrolase [Marinicaulis sp.]|nr:HAD-IA family hydrolase [Marinicaulis sp.]NNL89796.1 HAD-IA family hydrolase [Marinicaulis sp.]